MNLVGRWFAHDDLFIESMREIAITHTIIVDNPFESTWFCI